MQTTRLFAAVILVLAAIPGIGTAHAQTSAQSYPSKSVRIVTTSPGGGSDFAARIVAQGLSGAFAQAVIVDNRAGGFTAVETVANAQRDGYTLLLYANTMWIAPFLQKVSYDPIKDFAPVTLAGFSASVLAAHPGVPASSVKELIALAKARPATLAYGTGPSGSIDHLAGEHLKALTGIDLLHIPYKGGGPAVIAAIGGQVQLVFASTASIAPQVKAGKLKALAVASAQPTAMFPGLPTMAATLPGFEAGTLYGVFAPAYTPAAIINIVNREIVRILTSKDVMEKFVNNGTEVIANTPTQFAAIITSDTAKWGKVIRDAGIKGE